MTLFEKEFLLYCVRSMSGILSDNKKLQEAIDNYMENKTNDFRFKHNAAIPFYDQWTDEDALNFSAAVFESAAQANFFFYKFQSLNEISEATQLWASHCVPKLASDTHSESRMTQIKNNCDNIAKEIEQEMRKMIQESSNDIPFSKPQTTLFSLQEHPYAFFSAAVVGVGIVAATAVAVLRS